MRISDWSSDVCSSDLPLIQLPLDHQHRHPPLVHKPCRIEFLVGLGLGKRGSTVLPFAEPQFLGGIAPGTVVKDTVMHDQALPRRVPVAGDPVDHETAIAGAPRAARKSVV